MYYQELATQVRFYKETEKGREIMCKIIEDYGDKRAETTRIETMVNNIKSLMETMKWSADQAMNAMKISDSDKAILMNRF